MNISELLECLDEKLSIDEKIVSKKALKRKRRAAKKAAKKAIEKEQSKASAQDSQNTNTNQQTEQPEQNTQLIVYQQPQEEISEHFKKVIETLHNIMSNYDSNLKKAVDLWKNDGDDAICSMEIWEPLNKTVEQLQSDITKCLDQLNYTELSYQELQVLDIITTAINGYVQKVQQYILSLKPNLSLADLGQRETTKVDKPHNKRKKQKLITYKIFAKDFKKFDGGVKGIFDALKKASTLTGYTIAPIAGKVTEFFVDAVWAFLTQPLAKDIVKVLMYSNPITAFLFDNVKFGFDKQLDKLRQNAKEKAQNMQHKDNHTERGLCKDVSNYTLKELKREFYGNKPFVDLVNVAYNHPEVRIEDKKQLRSLTMAIDKGLQIKKIETVKTNMTKLVKVCDTICDTMDWNKPIQWQNLITKFNAKGNTQKELEKIKKKKVKDTKEVSADDYALLQKIKAAQQESLLESFNKLLEEAQR